MFLDNISHIYCLYSDVNDLTNFVLRKNQNISYKKYDLSSKFKDKKYFRDIAFYECIKDAYNRKYDNICILTSDIKILNEILPEDWNEYNIFCLNPKDVNNDCLIIDSLIISYIIQKVKFTSFTDVCWKENIYKKLSDNFKVFYPEKNYVKHKIDFVLTYVNDNDENWKKTYKETFGNLEYNSLRFKDYGTLNELILGIRKNAKFIDDIFIIVQNRSEVNISCKDIKIIEHKDIIPNNLLPTFNSCTIEMFLGNISGLSEYFIYGNDDMFFINEVEESDFFENGKLCVSLTNLDKANLMYHKVVQNSFKLFFQEFDYKYFKEINFDKHYKNLKHVPHPMRKSTCLHIYDLYDIQSSCSILRNDENLNQYIYIFYDYFIGNVKETSLTNEYIKNELKWKTDTKIICVNEYIDGLKEKLKYNININVALCAIAKNENLYIREWVEHYKKLGIAKIFLYDNNEIDGERFEEVINDYIESGYVEVIDVRGIEKGLVYDKEGINLQPKCYIDCYENKVKDFDYVCFFDIDEFLTFKGDWDLFSFLRQDWIKDAETILVPWVHYDDNDLITYDSRPVVERFTRKSLYKKNAVKSIVKCNCEFLKEDSSTNCLIHTFLTKNKKIWYSSGDKNVKFNKDNWYLFSENMLIESVAELNHYKTKTLEEYINRHLGRHWGTGKKYTDKPALSIKDIENQYFLYNSKTDQKIIFLNKFKNYNIIVSFTTWKERDWCVPKMLENFKNQTVKPTKIVCHLSRNEYDGIIPDSIKFCLDNNLLSEVKWVNENIYGHKRYEIFKEHFNDYVILIDDDILYPNDFIEKLVNTSQKNPNDVICYYTRTLDYNNGTRAIIDYDNNSSIKNGFYSGLCCFPPKSFPLESFNYPIKRDLYCEKCDDSWINAWLIKNNVKIKGVYQWFNKCLNEIENTQNVSIWQTHNSKKINGVMQKYINMCNAVSSLNIDVSHIWPNMNVNEYREYPNIICNNCIGARLYEVSNLEFPNPVMWCATYYEEFIYLIKNYDNIDLSKVDFSLNKYWKNKDDLSVVVSYKNEIKFNFIHYIQDDNCDSPVKSKNNTDILYKNILEYSKIKWNNRLKRLLNNNNPIFLFSFNFFSEINKNYEELLNKFLSLNTDKKIVLLFSNSINLDNKKIPNNIKILQVDDEILKMSGTPLCNHIKKYLI